MQCVFEKEGGATVVKASGRLDAASAPEFEQQCGKWIAEGGNYLVLDLENLEYISSAGLRSILMAAKKLKSNEGRLALCGLKDMVREVITISGFGSYIPIFENVSEAMAQG